MKKITAIFVAVLMVVSMVPAMALLSSADAADLNLGVWGTGAETWCTDQEGVGAGEYGAVTQFLPTVNDADAWAALKADMESGSCTWELKVTDLSGKTTTFTSAPASKYDGGSFAILRFPANDKSAYIQVGNTYDVELNVSVGGQLKYTGAKEGLTWSATTTPADCCTHGADGKGINHGIVVNGVDIGTEGDAVYTGETVDPYEAAPITATYYHSQWSPEGSDFEAHDTLGSNLLVGIPTSQIPKGGVAALDGAKVKLYIGKQVIETVISSTFGPYKGHGPYVDGEREETDEDCTYLRITVDPFPAEATYKGSTIEIYRKSDGKMMFTGKMDIQHGGDEIIESDLPAVVPGDDNNSGNTSGGNTSGGNTSGGNTSGGNTSGGNTSGGNTSGGNTSGGNTSGGNTSGGNTSGNNNNNGGNSGNSNGGDTAKTGDAVVYATVAMAVALVAMVVIVKKSRA